MVRDVTLLDDLAKAAGIGPTTKAMPNIRQLLEAIHTADRASDIPSLDADSAENEYSTFFDLPSGFVHGNVLSLLMLPSPAQMRIARYLLRRSSLNMVRTLDFAFEIEVPEAEGSLFPALSAGPPSDG